MTTQLVASVFTSGLTEEQKHVMNGIKAPTAGTLIPFMTNPFHCIGFSVKHSWGHQATLSSLFLHFSLLLVGNKSCLHLLLEGPRHFNHPLFLCVWP